MYNKKTNMKKITGKTLLSFLLIVLGILSINKTPTAASNYHIASSTDMKREHMLDIAYLYAHHH